MKTARSFVRRVRSKSPFRRRKRAETIIAEVREKEQAFTRQLNASTDQTSQPDDQAEIEVVLESSPLGSNYRAQSPAKTPPQVEDAVPELATSSSASTEDPPLTSAQAAARRFMERQQRIAAGNRRKSFRDRFMRSSKTTSAPPPPSPARSTKQMGITVRGRGRSTSSLTSSGREQGSKSQARGRSKERSVRGGMIRGSSSKSNKSKSSLSRNQERETNEGNNPTERLAPKKQQFEIGATVEQPVTIEVGVQSRVSELSTPAAIIRQESLGTESIRGVRQALQKMELELAAAGDAGKRVSRDKIMNALNFMAHSLHYDDQKQALAKELDAWIDESVIATERGRVYADEDDEEDNSDDDTSYSDDVSGSTFDLDAFEDGQSTSSTWKQKQTQSSFQDLFLRLGKFFTISDEDKTAVRQALDDLLWTELVDTRRNAPRRESKFSNQDDGSESTEDSIGNFDPLSCNIPDTMKEPVAPIRGRSWWRRHTLGGNGIKKENLYPVKEHPPSPESKISVPSPTGKVNPRSAKVASKSLGSGGKSMGSGEKSSRSGKTSGSGKSPAIPQPPPKKALTERTPVAKPRYMLDESDHSGWSSFDDTASDFWRQGDRYTIPSKPKTSTQQAQLVSHYKLSYPHSWPDNDPFLDSDFLDSPKEDEEFSEWDNCLHPAENFHH